MALITVLNDKAAMRQHERDTELVTPKSHCRRQAYAGKRTGFNNQGLVRPQPGTAPIAGVN
ncbi:MAG: hypothetical protein V4754_18000 [Pseudomonadota bacterium]